jgi:RNA polymerase sigma factor (sigma-70 family)
MLSAEMEDFTEWNRVKAGDAEARKRAIAYYWPFVIQLASLFTKYFPDASRQDAAGNGAVGLCGAVDSFNPDLGVRFKTFATKRIRYAMIDGIRNEAWAKRRGLSEAKKAGKSAPVMVPLSDFCDRDDGNSDYWMEMDFEALGGKPWKVNGTPPADARLRNESEWAELLAPLPTPRHRHIVRTYSEGGITMKQIGAGIGIGEARVSQLFAESAGILRQNYVAKEVAA